MGTKKQGFWPRIICSQMKLHGFESPSVDSLSKSAKFGLSKWIFYVKNHPNLSDFFFSLKNKNLGAHFLLLTFFDKMNFQITLFTKMMPYFWQLAISKTENSIISFRYADSYAKIFLILYPPLVNFTTRIAIIFI